MRGLPVCIFTVLDVVEVVTISLSQLDIAMCAMFENYDCWSFSWHY